MDPRSRPVKLSISVSADAYRVHESAVRRLRRFMGRQAPDLVSLVQSNLEGRDAIGLADDYLDSVRWSFPTRRKNSLHRPGRPALSVPREKSYSRLPSSRGRPPADPSRN